MSSDAVTAKLVSESDVYLLPGKLAIRELFFSVPISYVKPHSGTLQLFARSVNRHIRSVQPELQPSAPRPWLLYLQGGPGQPCPPPQTHPLTQILLSRGYQILYLDQRGTGLSTPVTAETLALKGSPAQQAEYLLNFRADSIVEDCEAVRRRVVSEDTEDEDVARGRSRNKGGKWSILGQSYGSFISLTYLSLHPSKLREVFTLGGLPPLTSSIIQVYTSTFQKLISKNLAYYTKYPSDITTVHTIATHISSFPNGIPLPSGGHLTVPRLLTLGISLGLTNGPERVHTKILEMKSDLSQFNFLTRPTLSTFERDFLPLDTEIIYALLHESIYISSGHPGVASNWTAYTVGLQLFKKEFSWLQPDFEITHPQAKWRPLFFSGEMIFPFLFDHDTYPGLGDLREVAEILARYRDWPKLYDLEQLGRNEVPVYAAIYMEDLYVSFELARESAGRVRGCQVFITNRLAHDALWTRTEEVMESLFELRDDCF